MTRNVFLQNRFKTPVKVPVSIEHMRAMRDAATTESAAIQKHIAGVNATLEAKRKTLDSTLLGMSHETRNAVKGALDSEMQQFRKATLDHSSATRVKHRRALRDFRDALDRARGFWNDWNALNLKTLGDPRRTAIADEIRKMPTPALEMIARLYADAGDLHGVAAVCSVVRDLPPGQRNTLDWTVEELAQAVVGDEVSEALRLSNEIEAAVIESERANDILEHGRVRDLTSSVRLGLLKRGRAEAEENEDSGRAA